MLRTTGQKKIIEFRSLFLELGLQIPLTYIKTDNIYFNILMVTKLNYLQVYFATLHTREKNFLHSPDPAPPEHSCINKIRAD